MSDREMERLQGCVDDCTKEIDGIKAAVHSLRTEHDKEIADIKVRLAVMESIIFGNGRPGLMSLLEKQSGILGDINDRLSHVEHTNNIARTRWSDKLRVVGLWILGISLIATLVFNIIRLL